MAGYFVLGVLAALGCMCILWWMFGWLLPSELGCALVCVGPVDEGTLWRWRWLRSLGLLRCPLLIAAEEGPVPEGTEICSREQLLPRLERERNRVDGTGNGDHPGRGQRRGISEL